MKNYQLKAETVLDEKYKISRVLGEGGFGITYEAVNERISLKVAIKELYIKGLLSRDVLHSNDVMLINEDDFCEFEKAKKHFLNEAKTLSSFSNEPGLVHILDYFEENGTTYIVMNYIEGMTLENYIKLNGTSTWSQVIDMIIPILVSLDKLHEKGIVHRDISSNNIMLTNDGTACLIDFGSTKDILISSDSKTTVVYSKQGYTPLEQFSKNGKVGPWSDIYAIMVVCYECITGKMPPDAVQRTVLDEYTTLKENKINAPKLLDEILLKGLEIDYKKRYQSVDEVLVKFKKLKKKETEHRNNKKKIIRCFVSIFVFLIVLMGIVLHYNHEKIIFKNIETEEFCIFFEDDITIKDLTKYKSIIKERVDVFAGDNPYIFDINDDSIRCVLPKECFHNEDIEDVIYQLFLYENKLSFYARKDGYPYYFIEEKYIEGLTFEDGMLRLKFSADTPDKVLNMLSGKLLLIRLKDDTFLECFKIEQLNNLEYIFDCKEGDNFNALIATIFKQDGLQRDACSYSVDIKAEWENVRDVRYAGKNQCNVNKFVNNYVTLKYKNDEEYDEHEWMNLMFSLKERLDILEIPYAIGIGSGQNRNIITIRVRQRDYNEDLFELMNYARYDIDIYDEYYRSLESFIISSQLSFEQMNDNILMTVDADKGYFDYWTKNTTQLSSLGLTKYHIKLKNFVVFDGELYNDSEDGRIMIDKIYFDDGKITEDNSFLIDLLNSIVSNDTYDFSEYDLCAVQYSSLLKNIVRNPKTRCENVVFDKSQYEEIADYMKSSPNGILLDVDMVEDDYDILLKATMSRDFYYETRNDISLGVEYIKEITDILDAEHGMLYDDVLIGIPAKNSDEYYAAKICIDSDRAALTDPPYSISLIGFEKEESEWIKQLYEALLEQKEFENVLIEYKDVSGE